MSTEIRGQIFTPATILARGRTVFNENNIPSSLYQTRIERIQQHLRTKRVNALVVAGEAFDQGSYAYITGNLEALWRPCKTNYAVVPSKGDPIMFTSGGQRELSFLNTQTWITDIRTARQAILDVIDGIKSFAGRPTRVGLVGLGPSKRAEAYRALQSQLSGVKFIHLDAFLERLRRVKDDREIAQVRRACHALDLEHETLLANLKAGVKDYEAEAKADRMARLEGARDAKSLWAAGPEGRPVLIPSRERVFTKGDNIAWFATVEYGGYWAEIGRDFSVGEPSEALAKMHNATVGVLERCIGKIKPGINVSKLYREIQSGLEASGYAANVQKDYGFGHAIGLDRAEKPFVDSSTKDVTQDGMVFSLRVPLYREKVGSVLVGDTVRVTEDGSESLTKANRELAVIALS
jgi:Xaa-Pro aminopeptidase